jgi:hypothetical protein
MLGPGVFQTSYLVHGGSTACAASWRRRAPKVSRWWRWAQDRCLVTVKLPRAGYAVINNQWDAFGFMVGSEGGLLQIACSGSTAVDGPSCWRVCKLRGDMGMSLQAAHCARCYRAPDQHGAVEATLQPGTHLAAHWLTCLQVLHSSRL